MDYSEKPKFLMSTNEPSYYKKMLDLQEKVFKATLSKNICDLEKYWDKCDKSNFTVKDNIVKVLEFNGILDFEDFDK